MKRLSFVAGLAAVLSGAVMANAASQSATDAATKNAGFAATLYSQLNKTSSDKNLFLSPYSISAALSMTAQGAKGNTADQMNKVLNMGADQPAYLAGMAEITTELNPQNAPFELSVSNGLWVDKTFPLAQSFVADSKKNFNAGVVPVDFISSAEAARKQINTAISAQTHDKIPELLAQGTVDSSTALVLTNAIYFKGTWENPFPKDSTGVQPFHAAGGKEETVPMMMSPRGSFFQYAETPDAQIVSLPYKGAPAADAAPARAGRGAPSGPSTLSMLIVLPKNRDGLADLEKQATAENLAKWSAGMRRQAVQVYLPRFTMNTQFELSKTLQTMGMTDAFTSKADFSGISASAQNKLAISAVIHKAYIDVNEEGTEAAAATAVTMVRSMAMPGNPVEFRADHPFMFMIRHEPTGSILFMGHMTSAK